MVDLAFEALVEATHANIEAERGALNRALKQIRAASPELDDVDLGILIRLRAEQYRKVMSDAVLTAPALAKHWNRLEAEQPKPTYPEPAHTQTCATCDGLKMVLVQYRPAKQTVWMMEHGIEPSSHPKEKGYEEWAVCPSCNSGANAGFWRADGSRFNPLDPAEVRSRISQ